MQKRAPQSMVAQSFTVLAASVATLVPGDLVKLSASMEVDFADAAGDIPIGEVVTIDKPAGKCVVELFGNKIIEKLSGAAITAGKIVKIGASRDHVVASDPAGTAADNGLGFGIALNTTNAAEQTVYILAPRF